MRKINKSFALFAGSGVAAARRGDVDLAVLDPDRHGAQLDALDGDVLTGADIELESVPRADHVGVVLREHAANARLVVHDGLGRQWQDLALAGGALLMRAIVFIGIELAAQLKNADLDSADVDDLAAGIG